MYETNTGHFEITLNFTDAPVELPEWQLWLDKSQIAISTIGEF